MPRRKQGAHLWLRPARKDKRGKLRAKSVWIIIDDRKHIATGCVAGQDAEAERALSDYIAAKHQPPRKRRAIEEIDMADVLSIYADAILPVLRARIGVTEDDEDSSPAIRKFKGRIGRLNEFWGGRMMADVSGDTCREYAETRTPGGARRDMEDLSAAIGHHLAEGFHREIVRLFSPRKDCPAIVG
jgi:hypothetical protein